jgi:hypothetical protein
VAVSVKTSVAVIDGERVSVGKSSVGVKACVGSAVGGGLVSVGCIVSEIDSVAFNVGVEAGTVAQLVSNALMIKMSTGKERVFLMNIDEIPQTGADLLPDPGCYQMILAGYAAEPRNTGKWVRPAGL